MRRSDERSHYEHLAHKWRNHTISPAEEKELMEWLNHDQDETLLISGNYAANAQQLKDDMYAVIRAKTAKKRPAARWWIGAAAAAAVICGVMLTVWMNRTPTAAPAVAGRAQPADVAPGGNMATLTLGNGQTVQLSGAQSGVVINASQLTYSDGSAVDAAVDGGAGVMMTAATPRGGTYQVILPDGSKVWLNAASSLKFPSTFGNMAERRVELTGEAYFEIAKVLKPGSKTDRLPFVVSSNGQQVEVLGTQFNVSGYPEDGAMKTTLVEGSVKVRDGAGHGVELRPGQQSIWVNGTVTVREANVEEAIAWKKGYFMFNDEALGSIMQKLSRWYNIDPVFEDKDLTTHTFFGTVSKSKPVSAVLNIMESTGGAHFTIEERKVIIRR